MRRCRREVWCCEKIEDVHDVELDVKQEAHILLSLPSVATSSFNIIHK